ncbi:hypothetical protein [Paraclostridium sordellii]|uniref:hypothetical protein n=1 Tax=Paraclostridium sordellii TaxID=1505 RepID=UPI0005E0E753|nr:hypothetical protein [Paeniclostridium sordellii]QYE97033.1 hypothetical protein KZ987_12350 [Paeniclostridium sordellii]CEN22292.1 Uncharacterised protein [[Clostridium] sordellii] [Paeniclostridium sordellii]CEP88647.1 Uncharacterised protein [[Clostridium] sordellii] [Paeniclostridium sordellii]CEP96876.1 Uncharacterised protein [[Clostridium] sordellii] [Paeniclostridium sordellii]CEQ00564.1 Uncharacterised protein [[Clostridium] sordellii] [Paeniclostridium sordellii]
MEIILILIACLIVFMIIKYLLKKILFGFLILVFSGIISFIYKIPYTTILLSISIIIYCILSICSELKQILLNLFKSRKSYLNGWYEKIVDLLFSTNYIVFMINYSIYLVRMSFSTVNTMNLVIIFLISWIFIWSIGHSKFILFKCLEQQTNKKVIV